MNYIYAFFKELYSSLPLWQRRLMLVFFVAGVLYAYDAYEVPEFGQSSPWYNVFDFVLYTSIAFIAYAWVRMAWINRNKG